MLYVPDPTASTTLVIPLASQIDADGGDVVFAVTDSTRRETYDGAVMPQTYTDVTYVIDEIFGLAFGQYEYELTQDGRLLSAGVLQVGIEGATVKQYQPTRTIKTYERD